MHCDVRPAHAVLVCRPMSDVTTVAGEREGVGTVCSVPRPNTKGRTTNDSGPNGGALFTRHGTADRNAGADRSDPHFDPERTRLKTKMGGQK